MNKSIFFFFVILNLLYASPLDIINNIRLKSGASRLKYSQKLSLAAKKHANYVCKTQCLGHYEADYSEYFYARAPWDRIVKSGFGTAVGIENISFYEPNYQKSIEKLMGTVYHRLAFLYPKIDSLGFASVGKIYVYEMSNSKIANLCKRHIKDAPMIINHICPNSSDIIPANLFNRAMRAILNREKPYIIYPYRNQKGVPLKGVKETPRFLYNSFGYPITITFNEKFYKKIKLKSFKLYLNGSEVPGKVVTHTNDIHGKIKEGSYVFAPLNRLQSKSNYKVKVSIASSGKNRVIEWGFTTR